MNRQFVNVELTETLSLNLVFGLRQHIIVVVGHHDTRIHLSKLKTAFICSLQVICII